jgi:hypothetical protein
MLATDRRLPTTSEVVTSLAEYIIYHGLIPVTCWGLVRALTAIQWELRRPMAGREN